AGLTCTPAASGSSAPDAPASFLGEALEEVVVVGPLGGLPDQRVDQLGIVADQDAPAIGPDAVEDDGRGGGGAGRRVLQEASRPLRREVLDVLVRQSR